MRFIFVILFASLLNPISLHANERDLMASALKLQKTITPDLSKKDKLARYELVISKIDQIIEGYGSTEIGLELLATDSIGNLDVTKLRSDYLKELIKYYDTTCKVSPSYACLGFISLSSANEICEKPSNTDSYVKASGNLINAIQIFDGQFDDNKYENVALSIYRQCVKDTPNDFTRDYLNSQLIDTLLMTGDESKARGIIEQMNTPFSIFNSALTLQKFKDQGLDDVFVERIKEYIKNKIIDGSERWFARINLSIARLEGVIEGKNELWTEKEGEGLLYWTYNTPIGECGSFENEYSFDLIAKIIFLNAKRLGKIQSFGFSPGFTTEDVFRGRCQNQLTILRLMDFKHKFEERKKKEIEKLHSEAILEMMSKSSAGINTDKEDAIIDDLRTQRESIFDHARNIEIAQEMFDYYKKNPSVSPSQAKLYFIDNYINSELEVDAFKMSFGEDLDTLYQIYKKKVDFGNACDASSILFKELVNTMHYEDGINYFISSPSMDPSIKYNCGDEDLELLLN